ncbi:MAG: hypothetical protein WBM50_05565 [Acidimicrobiales bacterium]
MELVDSNIEPIVEITETGILAGNTHHDFDIIVYATGFDAMTGSFSRIDIRGRGGQRRKDKWEAGPRTYLGLMSAGFPNTFMITGPGSPSVLSNMPVSIEQHVELVTDIVSHLHENGLELIEAGGGQRLRGLCPHAEPGKRLRSSERLEPALGVVERNHPSRLDVDHGRLPLGGESSGRGAHLHDTVTPLAPDGQGVGSRVWVHPARALGRSGWADWLAMSKAAGEVT